MGDAGGCDPVSSSEAEAEPEPEDAGVRVAEWEEGLPSADDLTPLSQPLIPRELATAFSIAPEPPRTLLDVHRASHTTLSSLRSHPPSKPSPVLNPSAVDDPVSAEAPRTDASAPADDSARTPKRPRLVWTPQLHKRFVDVVAHLGIKNAVPKTIMQLMNVDGLTRENVASHLQKYRLYLKRMHGIANEIPSSSSDHLFASDQQQKQQPHVMVPMPYMIPVPMYGMPHQQAQRSASTEHANNQQSTVNGGMYPGCEARPSYACSGETGLVPSFRIQD